MDPLDVSFGYECDLCNTFRIYSIESSSDISCSKCNKLLASVSKDYDLTKACPFCECTSYYKRKDFNQILGTSIIIIGAILSIIYNYFILMGFVILDILLFYIVPNVAVCYKCSVELRGFKEIDNLDHFDHHTAELYQFSNNNDLTT